MAGIQYAGEYILKEASLVTSSGVTIDLTGTILGIEIYENIFSTSLSGSILFVDENNIVTNGPIVGQEYLYLKISTPSLDEYDIDFTNVPFTTYKVNTREDANANSQLLQISFTSPEIIRNNRVRVSKSYTETIDKIVEDILRDERYINTAKKLHIEPTSGIRKVVSPNLHPYNFITNLATESISTKDGNPFFMFYETTKGINFRSIESMFAEESIGDYSMGDIRKNEGKKPDIQKEFGRILEFEIAKQERLSGAIKKFKNEENFSEQDLEKLDSLVNKRIKEIAKKIKFKFNKNDEKQLFEFTKNAIINFDRIEKKAELVDYVQKTFEVMGLIN